MCQTVQLTQLHRHLDGFNRQSDHIKIVENGEVLGELVGVASFQQGTQIIGRVPVSRLKDHARHFITSLPRTKIVFRNGEPMAVLITHKQD